MNTNLKTAFFKLQLDSKDCPIGQRPLVVQCDGHSTNTYNLALAKLAVLHNVLLICPPAHTSAPKAGGTQQCDQAAKLGGPITREKAEFRRLLRRQTRASLRAGGKGRGRITISEILRMYEMAIESSFDPTLIEGLNKAVGYYIGEDNNLHWDLLRTMDASSTQTSSTFGGKGGSSLLTEDMRSTKTGYAAVVFEQQQAVESSLEEAKSQIEAAGVVVERFNTAPVAKPAQGVSRKRGTTSTYGLVVSHPDHLQQLKDVKRAKATKANAAVKKIQDAWEKYRKDIRDAEAALAKKGTPSKIKVGEMKFIIRSRTGNAPQAKSNKKRGAVNDDEGAVLVELRAALATQTTTLLPPTPDKPPQGDAEGDDASDDGSIDDGSGAGGAGGAGWGWAGERRSRQPSQTPQTATTVTSRT